MADEFINGLNVATKIYSDELLALETDPDGTPGDWWRVVS